MAELVDLQEYRQRTPMSGRGNREPATIPPKSEEIDPSTPDAYGWLAIAHEDGKAVRWFHPGFVAQLGRIPGSPDWVFLEEAAQIRAWHGAEPGDIALGLFRKDLPEPGMTVPNTFAER